MRVSPALNRVRPRTAGLLGAALLALLTAAAAPAATAGATGAQEVRIDSTGSVSADGTVTLTGSYRCLSGGAVFVSSNLRIGDESRNLGTGVRAACDGASHRWSSRAKPEQLDAKPGPAQAEATLVHLTEGSLVPMPEFLAVGRQDITLVADGA
ncbi:DUF6299 family protein [Kitasatospora sp. NBC_01287]|uniref:DUF6299 family protein n=1 Tax=Kitasatospora sp. NBC_01287 TaxID=2903573 RepID=UPI0022545601|nr:DUF6299 family protein [Kitasatospora sp. NBC_01287]MCX4744867.1 DUF6299 family protein [Kitasatospora sp. NBC_01287]